MINNYLFFSKRMKAFTPSVSPLVAVTPDRGQVFRFRGILFDLDAKATYIHIHGFVLTVELLPPYSFEDILAGHGLAGILKEHRSH